MIRSRAWLATVVLTAVLGYGSSGLAQEGPAEAARAAIDEGRLAAAIAACDSGLALQPDDAELLALRGEARLVFGKIGDARADLERAASGSRRSAKKVAPLRSRIEFLYGRDDEALRLLSSLPESDADKKELRRLIHGPFARRLGAVAAVASGRSAQGHYLVLSDVGLTRGSIVPSNVGRGVREAGELFEASRHAVETLIPLPTDERVVLRAYVFASSKRFEAFSRSLDGESAKDEDGAFFSEPRVILVDAGSEPADSLGPFGEGVTDTIFHESFHQLVSFYAPALPDWLDEGLAEYFGATRRDAGGELEWGVVKKTLPGDDVSRYEDITEAIKDGTAPSLGKFVALTDEQFAAEGDVDRNYAQGWATAHFLMASPVRRKLVVDFLGLLHEGRAREEAFAATFGKADLDALDAEWRRYMAGL